MKQKYNELAQKQLNYFNKIQKNIIDFDKINQNPEAKQKFIESNYGLSVDEIRDMMKTKRLVDELLHAMSLEGINPTTEEMIFGFKEVD